MNVMDLESMPFSPRNTSAFRYAQGSIFDAFERVHVEAIVVFIPQGLTSIRWVARRYVENLVCLGSGRDGMFSLYRDSCGRLVAVCEKEARTTLEMRQLLDHACVLLSDLGIRRVAMNGIRVRDLPTEWHEAERLMSDYVCELCGLSRDPFEQVFFVDLRGGFNKAFSNGDCIVWRHDEMT